MNKPSCGETVQMVILNADYFWDIAQHIRKQPKNLLFVSHISLNDDDDNEHDSVVSVGIRPEQRFATSVELRSYAYSLKLDGGLFLDLLECISERFQEHAVIPTHKHINIQLLFDRMYKISFVDGGSIRLGEKALLELNKKRSYIKMYMEKLQQREYELRFFNLLHHFCYDASEKAVVGAIYSSPNMERMVDDMLKLECTCIDRSFTLEIILNGFDWFAECIPLFLKALMQTQ